MGAVAARRQAVKLSRAITLDEAAVKAPNLCDRFAEGDLATIGDEVWEGYRRDKQSRVRWERRNEAGMDLALQIQKDKSFPWVNCSNVAFPLVTIAAMQYHARAYPSIITGEDIVKCRVIGEDGDGTITARADRISTHMSWQVLEQDVAWEEQHDRLLLNVGIVGCAFVKSYYAAAEGHNVSELVLAKDLVIDYWAKSVEAAPRKTQIVPLYRNDIYERVRRGTYRDVLKESWYLNTPQRTDTGDAQQARQDTRQGLNPPEPDDTTPFRGLEQHVLMDLDDDGYAEPYIITIEEGSKTVLRIVTGFDKLEHVEQDSRNRVVAIQRMQYYTKYPFIPSPDGGLYDIGFGVLLGPLNESVNSAINQLFDAGTMATTAGGFLGRGVKIRGGVYAFDPFGWNRVDSTGDDLHKGIFPLPVREPSNVLFQLLSLLINYTNRISGANDMMVGENPGQNTPAETSRSMIAEGMKIYNAIFKRTWRAMKEEFRKLYVLNAIYLPRRFSFGPSGSFVLKEDYLGNPNAIAPAADPNISSEGEALHQAQVLAQRAATTPGYDTDAVERRLLKLMKVPAPDEIFGGKEKFPPGKDTKLAIAELNAQVKEHELQSKMALEAGWLQTEARKIDAEIANLQAELQIKLVELDGDVQDREVAKINAMVSMMKSQADAMRVRADTYIAELEQRGAGHSVQMDRADRALEATRLLVEKRHKDRELDQKDEELRIKDKVASKPRAVT